MPIIFHASVTTPVTTALTILLIVADPTAAYYLLLTSQSSERVALTPSLSSLRQTEPTPPFSDRTRQSARVEELQHLIVSAACPTMHCLPSLSCGVSLLSLLAHPRID